MSHIPKLTPNSPAIVGVILAGGQSLRMGQDKSQLLWHGQPLVYWVFKALQVQVQQVILSLPYAGPTGAHLKIPQLYDSQPNLGPLGGVREALLWSQHHDVTWLITTTCDTPNIPNDLASKLLPAAQAQGAAVSYATCSGREHYAHAAWSTAVLPQLEVYLAEGGRSIKGFLSRIQTIAVEFATPDGKPAPFFNVNTPADYTQLQHFTPAQTRF